MSDFYTDLVATVVETITEFGQAVTIQQQGVKTTNANGVSLPSNPTAMKTVGLMFDFSFRNYGNENIKGTLIESADKQLFIAPTPMIPQVQDKVIVAGNSWAIINIKQVNPAGTVLLYELWLKR